MNQKTYHIDGHHYRVISRTDKTLNLRICADPKTLAGMRELAGLKQYEMCERTGLTTSELSKFERAAHYGRTVPARLLKIYKELYAAK